MGLQKNSYRGRKVAAAVVMAGVGAGGALSMAGGATAGSGTPESGWARATQADAPALARARAGGADLVVQTRLVRDAEVDVGERGESPGDFFHFEERAFRPGTQTVIGRDAVRCEVGIRAFQCSGTIKIFGRGKIVVDGAFFGDNDIAIPITGGTGHFAGVGGTLRPLEGSGDSSRLAFHFVR